MSWSKYTEDNDGFSEERLTNTYGAGQYSYNYNYYWTDSAANASDYLRRVLARPRHAPFLEVNHQRITDDFERVPKVTSLRLCYYGNKPTTVSLLVDDGFSSQESISFRTMPKKRSMIYFSRFHTKGSTH